MLYMYALAISSLDTLSMFLAMQYSPYRRLNAENAVSAPHLLPQPVLLLHSFSPSALSIMTEMRLSGDPRSVLAFLLGLIIGFYPHSSKKPIGLF